MNQSLDKLLDEYASSHQNRTNKIIHYFAVPIIFWSVTAMLWVIKIPFVLNLSIIISVIVSLYYLSKDIKIAAQMIIMIVLCLLINTFLERAGAPLLIISVTAFVIAWVFQFIGHVIEGKRPSFFKDLQFLLVGPAWIVRQIFAK